MPSADPRSHGGGDSAETIKWPFDFDDSDLEVETAKDVFVKAYLTFLASRYEPSRKGKSRAVPPREAAPSTIVAELSKEWHDQIDAYLGPTRRSFMSRLQSGISIGEALRKELRNTNKSRNTNSKSSSSQRAPSTTAQPPVRSKPPPPPAPRLQPPPNNTRLGIPAQSGSIAPVQPGNSSGADSAEFDSANMWPVDVTDLVKDVGRQFGQHLDAQFKRASVDIKRWARIREESSGRPYQWTLDEVKILEENHIKSERTIAVRKVRKLEGTLRQIAEEFRQELIKAFDEIKEHHVNYEDTRRRNLLVSNSNAAPLVSQSAGPAPPPPVGISESHVPPRPGRVQSTGGQSVGSSRPGQSRQSGRGSQCSAQLVVPPSFPHLTNEPVYSNCPPSPPPPYQEHPDGGRGNSGESDLSNRSQRPGPSPSGASMPSQSRLSGQSRQSSQSGTVSSSVQRGQSARGEYSRVSGGSRSFTQASESTVYRTH